MLLCSLVLAFAAPTQDKPLALTDPPAEVELGMAMWEARLGRFSAAETRLDALRAANPSERIEREWARVHGFRELRDKYLGWLRENGKKLSLEHGGKKLKLVIERIDDGFLHFAKNKAELERLGVETLDPHALAQRMGKQGDALAARWIRLYPYVLADNKKWRKLLKQDSAAANDLRADAESDFPRLLLTGRCAFELKALADAPPPEDLDAADSVLARVAVLRSDGAQLAIVQERKGALRALAATAYDRRFDANGLALVFKGKYTDVGDGRIRLEYAFDDPAELQDFRVVNEFLQSHRIVFPKFLGDHPNEFSVEKGSLRTIGATALRHVAEFEAPVSVTYEVLFEPPPEQNSKRPLIVNVGICDDGGLNFAWVFNLGDLEVWKNRNLTQDRVIGDREIPLGVSHKMRIRHDGKGTVEVHRDGNKVSELEGEHLRRGSVFLWIHSGLRVQFKTITIEGGIVPDALAKLKAEWIEAQLAGF